MTLRRKIVLSNILAVVLPILLIVIIWAGYVRWGNSAWLKPINRASDGGDMLAEAMNVLYAYEAELSDMHWNIAAIPDEGGAGIIILPQSESVEELKSLGYHIQVETDDSISFSNMDESDQSLIEETGIKTEGAIFWSGNRLVIQDSFRISEQDYYLTTIYNKHRADTGVQSSLLPMYMVTPAVLVIFLVITVLCIVFTSMIIARWMNRSVLVPLDELKKGANMIAGGDLDYRIPYPGRDEFGDVCNVFDRMRMQLKEAKEKQKRYEEERREMLRGISHDLRSPLTSIKGYALGLKDGIAGTEEKKQKYYEAILTRADDLERLTESLSLLVKLENSDSILHLERVCLDEYIRQFLSEKKPWIRERSIDVSYRTDCASAEVFLDIREMQRVLMNLFENTVKYRQTEHSKVHISVKQGGSNVEIRFSDDGPGVGAKHLKHLFESFYRADESRTNPEKGSGLGLAVVKRIIEGQNGKIYAASDRGLSIIMILPIAQEEKAK